MSDIEIFLKKKKERSTNKAVDNKNNSYRMKNKV